MERMTPEERFTKIENAIYFLTESQTRQEGAIRDLVLVSRTLVDSQGTLVDSQRALIDSQGTLVDSQRTLVDSQGTLADSQRALVDSQGTLADSQRALVDYQRETTVQIQALASEMSQLRAGVDQMREAQQEAQQATDGKLHILIETVDRIIRNQKK